MNKKLIRLDHWIDRYADIVGLLFVGALMGAAIVGIGMMVVK